MDLDPGGKIVMRRQSPKVDGGKQSQGLGEAEKTGELVTGKVLDIAMRRKSCLMFSCILDLAWMED